MTQEWHPTELATDDGRSRDPSGRPAIGAWGSEESRQARPCWRKSESCQLGMRRQCPRFESILDQRSAHLSTCSSKTSSPLTFRKPDNTRTRLLSRKLRAAGTMASSNDKVKRFFSSPKFAVAGASQDQAKFGYKSESAAQHHLRMPAN